MENSNNAIEKEIVYHDDLYVWQLENKKKNVLFYLFSNMTKQYNELKEAYEKAGMLEIMKSIKHPEYKKLQKEFDAKYQFI